MNLRVNRDILGVLAGTIIMFYIGWFPFGAVLTGIAVTILVRGKWLKKILYSILSACIGLTLVMFSLYYSEYSVSMIFNMWTIEVIIIELTLVFLGSLFMLLAIWIFNLRI
ncbi:hypothetical protein DRN84_01745 [Candidatus Geothermarchaeota archaeon]|nr:MAG: hypothetical protein DRN87_03305 [Candidatus Geothermarchaeota archaeon]RLG62507.1 MAG: hypothetical protein DRN84_01745 [Candidatus Geothermarchaeota archaeon]HEW93334.1 hypothetical protein [Thermoprotei archaeon]